MKYLNTHIEQIIEKHIEELRRDDISGIIEDLNFSDKVAAYMFFKYILETPVFCKDKSLERYAEIFKGFEDKGHPLVFNRDIDLYLPTEIEPQSDTYKIINNDPLDSTYGYDYPIRIETLDYSGAIDNHMVRITYPVVAFEYLDPYDLEYVMHNIHTSLNICKAVDGKAFIYDKTYRVWFEFIMSVGDFTQNVDDIIDHIKYKEKLFIDYIKEIEKYLEESKVNRRVLGNDFWSENELTVPNPAIKYTAYSEPNCLNAVKPSTTAWSGPNIFDL